MNFQSLKTTLCYILADGKTLLLRRDSEGASNEKWIPPGSKFELGEAPEEGVVREVYEETGLTLTEVKLRGILRFVRYAKEQ